MKLTQVLVTKFKNIIDSTEVEIEEDITCLVGKNEAGKSAFLNALYRLNPYRQNVGFIIEDHYPAWLEKKDRMQGIDLNNHNPIKATFKLNASEIELIKQKFGENILSDEFITIQRSYNGDLSKEINLNEAEYIKTALKDLSFSQNTRSEIQKCNCVYDLTSYLDEYTETEDTTDKEKESITTLRERLNTQLGEENELEDAIYNELKPFIPKFIYFDKYSTLPYSVNIKELLSANEANLSDDELTARSLLRMAATDDDYILNPDYERRKRELENVANAITQDVLKYWSQNQALRVSPDITQKTVSAGQNKTTVIDELKIRIWDDKHFLSLPFNEHSTGFQWFFSFLAAFSEYEYSKEPVIILLDEPGLGLHGKAQADFLRFIEDRLAEKRQVVYSTHSPFMVQPNRLDRARVVEEKDRNEGSKVTKDVLTTDSDTLFPLQGALGYDLVQNLFVSKNNLILEGTSDYTYLIMISEYLNEKGRTGLREEWSLVPVGGADLIPTFVALLGTHLDVTVVIDARKEGNQKLSNLAHKGYLKSKKIIALSEITGNSLADIEDIFDPEDYLKIYNDVYGKEHKVDDLQGVDQIVNKIARIEGITRFNHGKPADHFLRNRDKFLDMLSDSTLDNFERLFIRINDTYEDA